MIPRKWSNKSQKGAVRIPSRDRCRPYKGKIVDPFSDWSKSYYRYKAAEAKSLQRKRRDKINWEQRQVALYRQHTEVAGLNPVNSLFQDILERKNKKF